jgi:hypothetical protein
MNTKNVENKKANNLTTNPRVKPKIVIKTKPTNTASTKSDLKLTKNTVKSKPTSEKSSTLSSKHQQKTKTISSKPAKPKTNSNDKRASVSEPKIIITKPELNQLNELKPSHSINIQTNVTSNEVKFYR